MHRRLIAAAAACFALSSEAQAADGPFTTACVAAKAYDVRLAAVGQSVEVKVVAKRPDDRIERVLLRSPYKAEATALPTTQAPAADAGQVATFDLQAIQALPAGDINAVVMTPDGERVCRIVKGRQRKHLAPR
jgi:hypothetical protein